jgi:hypothetical protein
VRFALAYLTGRGPRYVIFAWCSVVWDLSGLQILLIQVGLLLFAVGMRLAWRERKPAAAPAVGAE